MPYAQGDPELRFHNADQQWEAIGRIIDIMKPVLELQRFHIISKDQRLDAGTLAEAHILPHNHEATLVFDLQAMGLGVDSTIETVLHEMIHVVLFPHEGAFRILSNFMADHGLTGQGMFESVRANATERTLENVEDILLHGLKAVGLDLRRWIAMEILPGSAEIPFASDVIAYEGERR